MKRILKNIIIITIIYIIPTSSLSQDIYDKFSRKLCKCLEKEKVQSPSGIEPCFEELLVKNMKELKKAYKVQSFSDINTEDLGNKIRVRMLKDCDYAIEIFSNQEKEEQEKIVKQANLTCNDLKCGDFYYLTNKTNIVPDTTHVTISKNMFLERMNNGRTYSLLNINWQDECNFELEFKESNDPLKKELSTPADKYKYEILANREEYIVLKVFWGEHEFQVEFFKGK